MSKVHTTDSISVTELVNFFKCPASLIRASSEFKGSEEKRRQGIETHAEIDRKIKRSSRAMFSDQRGSETDLDLIFPIDTLKR